MWYSRVRRLVCSHYVYVTVTPHCVVTAYPTITSMELDLGEQAVTVRGIVVVQYT